jgi:hypothetical protein
MSILQKLTAVMFYASLPLLIPFFYSLYNGDGGWVPIGMTIFILASPALPGVIMGQISSSICCSRMRSSTTALS